MTWNEASLLVVPMHVNGLYVSGDNCFETIDNYDHFDYAPYRPLGIYMESDNGKYRSKMKAGIYLHWVLPKAMRHGILQEDGDTVFPHIPNRYHVMRMKVSHHGYEVTTTVIESDAVVEDGDVSFLKMEGEKLDYAYIGRSYPLGEEITPCKERFDLTALGYGDPSFSGFYDKTQNILSYYDDLKDADGEEEYHYLVVGYYEETTFEPFEGIVDEASFRTVMEGLKWHVEGDVACDAQIITAGLITLKAQCAKKPEDDLQLSVGQNLADALSTKSTFPRSLQYFLNQRLSEPIKEDSVIKQERDLHEKQFDIGIRDDIYRIEQEGVISQEDALTLDALNHCCRLTHHREHLIQSLREDGYVLWYKYYHKMLDLSLSNQEKQNCYDQYEDGMRQLYAQIGRLEKEITRLKEEEHYHASKLPHKKQIKDDAYWMCKNPTLLIQSDHSLRNLQYGYDVDEQSFLLVRGYHHLLKGETNASITGNFDRRFLPILEEACILLEDAPFQKGIYPDQMAINHNETAWQYIALLWQVYYLEDRDLRHWELMEDDFVPKQLQLDTTQKSYTVDRCLLTPQADRVVNASLEKYQSVHQSEKLMDVQQEHVFVDVLSQTLGTFREQLRGRKATFQIPLADCDDVFYKGTSYDAFFALAKKVIKDETQVSLLQTNVFHCMRAGTFHLAKAQLIDSFSRIRDIAVDDVCISDAMKAQQEVILTPRLLQPVRLFFSFGDRIHHSSLYPVIGWIRYNYVNHSLILYEREANYIGELKRIHHKLCIINAARTIEDEDFQQIICTLQQYPKDYDTFLNIIEKRQRKMKEVIITEEDVSMYIGHPLALIKGECALQLQGAPIRDTAWCEGHESHSPLLDMKFKARFGDIRSSSDGLVGFFMKDGFHQAYEEGDFFKRDELLLEIEKPQSVILLMNLYLETSITTGILPKKIIAFGSDSYKNLIQTMTCSFLLGPTLQPYDHCLLPMNSSKEIQWQLDEDEVEYTYGEELVLLMIREGVLKMRKETKPQE